MHQNIPFLVEDRLKELGATFEQADAPFGVSDFVLYTRWRRLKYIFQVKVVVDGILITGQNPASAKGVGEELDKMLSA